MEIVNAVSKSNKNVCYEALSRIAVSIQVYNSVNY